MSANLALLGDKRLLFSQEGDAFIMYAVEGRSWIAMGDPVGPDLRWSDLIWEFHELSDRYGGRTAFYEVGHERLHLYLDLGLSLLKLGQPVEFVKETHTCCKIIDKQYVFEVKWAVQQSKLRLNKLNCARKRKWLWKNRYC